MKINVATLQFSEVGGSRATERGLFLFGEHNLSFRKMEQPESKQRLRHKGRFISKRKLQCQTNVGVAAKRISSQQIDNIREKVVEGRRIVEIDQIAENLWCHLCSNPISLHFIEKETTLGIVCFLCDAKKLFLILLKK